MSAELRALFDRGNRYLMAEDTHAAAAAYEQCLLAGVSDPALTHNTALCLQMQCRFDEAGQMYEALTEAFPTYVRAWVGVSNCCRHKKDRSSAVAALKKALEVDPRWPQAHYLLSSLYMQSGDVEGSVMQALMGYAASSEMQAHDTLHFVRAYLDDGRGRVHTLRTGAASILDMLYAEAPTQAQLLTMHRFFATCRTSGPPEQAVVPLCSTSPLRVGYMSQHLASHTVGCCILPVLERHSSTLDVYVYDLGRDAVNLPPGVVHRKYDASTDATTVRRQVLKDNLDVLVSLDGWTGSGATMGMLEHKLAGTCVDMWGYPFSTGSQVVQHKVVDAVTDPAGYERDYTESLLRLPGCFLCWRPKCPPPVPRIRKPRNPPRLLSSNNFKKLSPSFLRTCRRILDATSCVLCFKCSFFDDSLAVFEALRDKHFRGYEDRVQHVPHVQDDAEHLRQTATYDLALDPWPYNGTITTLECLASGVPVLCMLGGTHRSRVSASILTAIGHGELISMDEDHYVQQAVTLLSDHDRLAQYHAYLPRDLQASCIADAEAFTRSWETALRGLCPRLCD